MKVFQGFHSLPLKEKGKFWWFELRERWEVREVCYNFQRGFYSLHLKLNDEEEFEGWLISKSEEVESAENSLEFHTRVITVYSKETKEKGFLSYKDHF